MTVPAPTNAALAMPGPFASPATSRPRAFGKRASIDISILQECDTSKAPHVFLARQEFEYSLQNVTPVTPSITIIWQDVIC
jgi:hypothetical protein